MRSLSWKLAYARLRKYPLHAISVAVVVALALISLFTLQGISHSSSNSLVTYALSKLPDGDRVLTISSNRIFTSTSDYASIDKYLAKNLSGLTSAGLSREVLYHEISDSHGVGFYFGGVDALVSRVHLKSGRLPAACTSTRCEVLQVGGQTGAAPRPDSFGLIVVGVGEFTDNRIFTGTFAPAPGVPVLVADGIAAVSSMPSVGNFQGSDGWIGEINLKSIEREGLNNYRNSILAFENKVSLDHSGLTLTWPSDALAEASNKSSGLVVRLILLSYIVGALLVAFLILLSLRQKDQHFRYRAGLSRIGTPQKTLAEELLIENVVPLLLGLALAVFFSPLIPHVLNAMHFHADLTQIYHGWQRNFLLLFAALALTSGFAILGDQAWLRRAWVPFLLAAGLLYAYFAASGEHEPRVWGIPLLFAIMPVVLSYLALRWLSVLWRGRSANTYVLIRENFGMWQGVASILTLTTLLAVITLSFESGIQKSVITQAQDEVPLDVSVKTSASLIRPFDLGGITDYEHLLAGSSAYPVLRIGSSIRGQSTVADSLSLIGVAPESLSKMTSSSLRELSTTIKPTTAVTEPGVNVAGGSRLVVELSNIPKEIDLIGWFRTPRGTHTSFTFIGNSARRTLLLRGRVPTNSRLVGFELRETSDYLSRRLHAQGEGSFSVPVLRGVGSILNVSIDGRTQTLTNQDWNLKKFPYVFDGGRLFVRPIWQISIPRVVVDPVTAALARNGVLTLAGGNSIDFQVRIGAVRDFFPSAGNRFAIMDIDQLQQVISRNDPGAIDPIEIWVSTPHSVLYLDRVKSSGFHTLLIQSHGNALREFRVDPLNVGSDGSYKIALLFALVIAFFIHATALPLLRKESAELLFHLEVVGVGPSSLRKALRRALRFTFLIGIVAGLAIGLLVARFYISESTPFMTIALSVLAAVASSEVGGYFFTRKFFAEPAMVGASR